MSGHPTNGPQAPAVPKRIDIYGGPLCGRVLALPRYPTAVHIAHAEARRVAIYERPTILTQDGLRYVFAGYWPVDEER